MKLRHQITNDAPLADVFAVLSDDGSGDTTKEGQR